jgi:hypothetical protein
MNGDRRGIAGPVMVSMTRKSSGNTTWIAALLFASLLPGLSLAATYSANGRDIGCAETGSGRARQICDSIAASLEWEWLGHATIAPGYKPTFAGVRTVYCALKIDESDMETLRGLKSYDPRRKWSPDWRLESGADMLMRIVASLEGAGDEPENSIFNPQDADYVLKNGCP